MQQMSEFMENGFHFAVRQQRRGVAYGRRKISADQAKVRLAKARIAGDEGIHPGSATFVLAGEPVRIESAQQLARVAVLHSVVLHRGVPSGNSRLFHDSDTEQP